MGARITADEPFYLMTTESVRADGDLDLRNQYERMAYARFFDASEPLWHQSAPRADGAIVSPHNLGLSVLVLPAYAVGGLDGVKAFLGLVGGLTVGAAFLLARRVSAPVPALFAAVLAAASASWFVYATQIYPEMPAALLIALVVWRLLGAAIGPRSAIVIALALVALMWLGVKYAALVASLALLAGWRSDRAARAWLAGIGVVGGLQYLAFHVATFGGPTPYSLNRLYAGSDTVELLQFHWGFIERAYRLLALWADREFGLVRWAPALLLALPGAWLLLRRRFSIGCALVGIIAVQLAVATFLSITMRGWWFPGRMMIVVLPLLVPLMAVALAHLRPAAMTWLVGVAAIGASVSTTLALWLAVRSGSVTLAVNPFEGDIWWLRATDSFFPLFTIYDAGTLTLSLSWVAFGLALLGWAERSYRTIEPSHRGGRSAAIA